MLGTLSRAFLSFRNSATRAQLIDFSCVEAQLLEHLLTVLTKSRRAPCRHFGDAMHLNRAADRRRQLAAGAFERHDDVIGAQLRIVDYLLRLTHEAEGDVDAIEDLIPMRHRLRAEELVENRRQLGHVRYELRRIGKSRVRQEIWPADRF